MTADCVHYEPMPRNVRTGSNTKLTNAVIDRITEIVADGNYLITAARVVGLSHDTIQDWLEIANEAKAAKANGQTHFSQHQQKCLLLRQKLDGADGVAESTLIDRINLAGQPRRVRKTTIRREPVRHNGVVQRLPNGDIEYTQIITTEEREEQDWRAALEVLKRRYGNRWGDKINAEVSGPRGGPIRMSIPDQPTDRQTMGDIADAFVEAGLMTPDDRAVFDTTDPPSPNGHH